MKRILSMLSFSLGLACSSAGLHAQQASPQATQPAPPRPPIQTTRVAGTDNVYIFRNGSYQSMFVVTGDGVIATDPIAYGRPTGGSDYLDEIRKVTDQPVKYVVYSHHHFDHIAGGKAFKDAGAVFVAHERTRQRLARINDPHTVLPDIAVDDKGTTLRLGGTELVLSYYGQHHADSSLIMRLPREKILFVVDTIAVGHVPGRALIDFYPLEAENFMKEVLALDWDYLIPGHPGPGDRLGTKKDVEDQLKLLQVASATMKDLARQGKCWDLAEKEFSLPDYQNWPGYAAGLPYLARRYCSLWGRGT